VHLWTSAEAARALGVGVSSIKRWTDEGALVAVRTPGQHRRYTADALHHFAQAHGLPANLLPPQASERPRKSRGRRLPSLLEALRRGDEASVRRLVTPGTNDLAARAAFLDSVIGDTLREIGARWERGAWTVDEEHRASYLISEAVDRLRPPAVPPTRPMALLACPPGELHDLPLRLVRLLLEWAGWRTEYAGADVPWDALHHAVETRTPRLVALSARSSEPFRNEELAHFLALCRERAVEVIAGGEWCRGGSGRDDGIERFRTLRGYVRSGRFRRFAGEGG
jgi:excisionase family DNA binding protein